VSLPSSLLFSLLPTIIVGKKESSLKNIPVTGRNKATGKNITPQKLTITNFGYDGGLLASGDLVSTGKKGAVKKTFKNKSVGIISDPAFPPVGNVRQLRALQGNNTAVCDVLFLDLESLFLDVLGLTVDLDPVILDINAVPGAGNLLGNLLCAVAGLLDGGLSGLLGGLGGLPILAAIIDQVLNAVNGLAG
jgi:hypothetical protein